MYEVLRINTTTAVQPPTTTPRPTCCLWRPITPVACGGQLIRKLAPVGICSLFVPRTRYTEYYLCHLTKIRTLYDIICIMPIHILVLCIRGWCTPAILVYFVLLLSYHSREAQATVRCEMSKYCCAATLCSYQYLMIPRPYVPDRGHTRATHTEREGRGGGDRDLLDLLLDCYECVLLYHRAVIVGSICLLLTNENRSYGVQI